MNLQIYVDNANKHLSCVSQGDKREIFVKGLLRKIQDVDRLKLFISENQIFDIVNVEGNTIMKRDGTSVDANFEMFVDDSYIPRNSNDVYCVISCFKSIFRDGSIILIHPLYIIDKVPVWFLGFQQEIKDGTIDHHAALSSIPDRDVNGIKKHVSQLLDLFMRGRKGLGSHLTDEDIESVQFLQNFIVDDGND